MESLKERVRAKPAYEASASFGFGLFSWGLGLAELFVPHQLLKWMGVDARLAPVLRGFGLREIGAGIAILQNPVDPRFVWSRVAGDALDLLTLGLAFRSRSRRPDRVDLVISIVGVITVFDILMSARLTRLSTSKTAKRIAK